MNYRENIKEFYALRDENDAYERQWGYTNPVSAEFWRMRDALVFAEICRRFDTYRSNIHVLEVGSGHGHELAKLSLLGIPQHNLVGVDLVESRVDWARKVYPAIEFHVQDATVLSFPDNSFDLVVQFTCLMHAPTKELQSVMCHEMARVLKTGGMIIWWDLAPTRWRTLWLKRFCQCFGGPATWRQLSKSSWKTIREVFSPSAHRTASMPLQNSGPLFVESSELAKFFPGLKVVVHPAGVHYEIWESLWRVCRPLARLLWHWGYFSQHCFAVIHKP